MLGVEVALLVLALGLELVYFQLFAGRMQPFIVQIEQGTAAWVGLVQRTHRHSEELGLPPMPQLQLTALLSDLLFPFQFTEVSTF